MRIFLAVIFLTLGAFGQSAEKNVDRLQSSCGPSKETFAVSNSKQKGPLSAESTKALVIIIEQFDKRPGELAHPTLRIGVDGSWVGATQDNSYFPFPVEPGERHLCVQWQSRFTRVSQLAAFASLNADAGKTYYYRAIINYPPPSGGTNMHVDLNPVDQAEGEYLLKINPVSSPNPSK